MSAPRSIDPTGDQLRGALARVAPAWQVWQRAIGTATASGTRKALVRAVLVGRCGSVAGVAVVSRTRARAPCFFWWEATDTPPQSSFLRGKLSNIGGKTTYPGMGNRKRPKMLQLSAILSAGLAQQWGALAAARAATAADAPRLLRMRRQRRGRAGCRLTPTRSAVSSSGLHARGTAAPRTRRDPRCRPASRTDGAARA